MIPTMLLLGLLAGVALASRWAWWSILVLGVFWGALVAGQPSDPEFPALLSGLSAIPLGMVNAAVGVLVGIGIRQGVVTLLDR